jgi:hypothetical protein
MAQQVDVKGFGLVEFPDQVGRETMLQSLRRKFAQMPANESGATVAPYNPSLSERAKSGIANALSSSGLISNPYQAQRVGENVGVALDFLPIVGDAIGGDDLGRAIRSGSAGDIGFAALGAIPVIGDAAKVGIKSIDKQIEAAKAKYDAALAPLREQYRTADVATKEQILQKSKELRMELDYLSQQKFRIEQAEKPKNNAANAAKAVEPEYKSYQGKVYHMTGGDFDEFDFKKSADNSVWFTTDKAQFDKEGSAAAAASGKGRIIEGDIKLEKLAGWKEMDKYTVDELIGMGYDGAMLDGDIQVFNTGRVKLPSASVVQKPANLFEGINSAKAARKAITEMVDLFDYTPDALAKTLADASPVNVTSSGAWREQKGRFFTDYLPDGSIELRMNDGKLMKRMEPDEAARVYKQKIIEIESARPEAQEAFKQKELDRAKMQQQQSADSNDYRMSHRAPTRDGNPTADDLSSVFDDIYGANALRLNSTGMPFDKKAIEVIQSIRGNPDKEITIYRALPKGVKDINAGDWVTTTREYAEQHAKYDPDYVVISKKVKAKDIATDGNSIHEFGYDPSN